MEKELDESISRLSKEPSSDEGGSTVVHERDLLQSSASSIWQSSASSFTQSSASSFSEVDIERISAFDNEDSRGELEAEKKISALEVTSEGELFHQSRIKRGL